jgi:hypothetical protein
MNIRYGFFMFLSIFLLQVNVFSMQSMQIANLVVNKNNESEIMNDVKKIINKIKNCTTNVVEVNSDIEKLKEKFLTFSNLSKEKQLDESNEKQLKEFNEAIDKFKITENDKNLKNFLWNIIKHDGKLSDEEITKIGEVFFNKKNTSNFMLFFSILTIIVSFFTGKYFSSNIVNQNWFSFVFSTSNIFVIILIFVGLCFLKFTAEYVDFAALKEDLIKKLLFDVIAENVFDLVTSLFLYFCGASFLTIIGILLFIASFDCFLYEKLQKFYIIRKMFGPTNFVVKGCRIAMNSVKSICQGFLKKGKKDPVVA